MVSRFVRIEKASGSIPDISIFRNIKELKRLNRKINLNLLESIEYFYYSKNYTGKKEEKKKDNKGIRGIKKFVLELYIKFGEYNKKDE